MQLLMSQKTEIDELYRLIRNYKADGPTRKILRYLDDKLATFDELFRVIKNNDDELAEVVDDEQPYTKRTNFRKNKKFV